MSSFGTPVARKTFLAVVAALTKDPAARQDASITAREAQIQELIGENERLKQRLLKLEDTKEVES